MISKETIEAWAHLYYLGYQNLDPFSPEISVAKRWENVSIKLDFIDISRRRVDLIDISSKSV